MLGAHDDLPARPRRVLVAGVSGVGKTTLCRQIALISGCPHTEIDALFHGPNWVPRAAFLADVAAFTSAPTWVTEWQYHGARPLLLDRADTLIWLDLPARVSLYRVIRRTIRRRHGREVLWNGNLEPGLWHAFTARDGIVRWAIVTRRTSRQRVAVAAATHPRLQIVRLRSRRQVVSWLTGPLTAAVGAVR